MAGEAQFSVQDFSQEKSSASFVTRQATSANFDAIAAEIAALLAAIQGVITGNVNKTRFVAQVNTVDAGAPATPSAQREMKWLLQLQDDSTGSYIQREVPTADITTAGLLIAGTDVADLTNAAWVAMAAAIDGIFLNPATGNTVSLVGARLVGRNI
jgi:hypothetical protein